MHGNAQLIRMWLGDTCNGQSGSRCAGERAATPLLLEDFTAVMIEIVNAADFLRNELQVVRT